jgi:hypothetical protein
MNKKNLSKIQMMQLLVIFALDAVRIDKTNLVQVFKLAIEAVKGKLAQIALLQELLSDKGIARDKKAIKKACSGVAFNICQAVVAFAKAHNDNTLLAKVSRSVSAYMKILDGEFVREMTNLHDLIQPLVETMIEEGYYISEADLTAFLSEINAFSDINLDPEQAKNKRIQMNKNINDLTKEAFAIVRNSLDPNSASFKSIDMKYYDGYVINRRVEKPITITTKCRVKVLSDIDGTPIFDAEITISGTTLKTKTNVKGDGTLNRVKFGTRKVSVSVPGYQTQTSPNTVFKKGHYVDITFRLVPDNFTIPASKPEIALVPQNA